MTINIESKGEIVKISVQPGVTDVHVTGLLPGQVVEVTATNAAGTGPASSFTEAAPTSVPDAPVVSEE